MRIQRIFLSFTFILSITNCLLTNDLNQDNTILKESAESRIGNAIYIKTLSCNFLIGQAVSFAELGSNWGKEYSALAKYEKKAVDHCINSILSIPCPTYPINTENATVEMSAHLSANRYMNCSFKTVKTLGFI